MAEEKSQRLGWRGQSMVFESALRLLGTGNATGLIAAGAAFNVLREHTTSVKWAGMLFLFGVFSFISAYAYWFMATIDFDRSLYKRDDANESLLLSMGKTVNEYRLSAKINLHRMLIAGAASFFFLVGGAITVFILITIL